MAEVVKAITGIDERNWNFKDKTNKVKKNCGEFRENSVKDLLSKINNPKYTAHDPAKIKVTLRDSFTKEHLFDSSILQLNSPTGSLFQVASNFNCLEIPSHRTDPFSGYYLGNLVNDKTQGPAASGGALYGAVDRLIINKAKPINLLSLTGLEPKNGKLFHNDVRGLPDPMLIKVGVQRNTVACVNTTEKGMRKISERENLINQVFCSTIILRGKGLSETDKVRLSRPFLRAAYLGTYTTAIVNSLEDTYLTLIGGSSFANPLGTIVGEIAKVHREYACFLPKNSTVNLPIYDPKSRVVPIMRSMDDVFDLHWP